MAEIQLNLALENAFAWMEFQSAQLTAKSPVQPPQGQARKILLPTPIASDSVEISPKAYELLSASDSSIKEDEDLSDQISADVENDMKIQLLKAIFGSEEAEKLAERIKELNEIREEPKSLEPPALPPGALEVSANTQESLRLSASHLEMDVQTSRGESLHVEYNRVDVEQTQRIQQADPLVLDLDGDGVELTSFEKGVQFDVNADGRIEKTAFAAPDDGLLAADWNANGLIDNTQELFGNLSGAADGFSDLARYDTNRDNEINAQDEIFSRLRIWQEQNGDGISQQRELSALNDMGITSILLNHQATELFNNGNKISNLSSYLTSDGTQHAIGDAWLNYLAGSAV